MRTLDLECPSCGEKLELDAGFAGGVCRCSSCGTLMTVPSDAAGGAERLSRPSPGARPGTPSGGSSVSDPGELVRSGRTPRSQTRRRPARRGRSGSHSVTLESGEYRTATGRVVRIDQAMRVPMARGKRKSIRAATAIIFMSVVLGVAAVGAIAVWAMMSSDAKTPPAGPASNSAGDTAAQAAAVPAYDAQANPFLMAYPNIAGLPLDGRVAVVVEASDGTQPWMAAVGPMLRAGLCRSGGRAQAAVFAACPEGTVAFNSGVVTPTGQLNPSRLDRYFEQLAYGPNFDMTQAVKDAMAVKPDMLILVLNSAPPNRVDEWRELLEHREVMVHTVLVDGYSTPLRTLMRDRRGSELVMLTSDAVEDWQHEAESPSGQ